MKIFKKRMSLSTVIFITLGIIYLFADFVEFESEIEIPRYDAVITLDENGDMIVDEIWTMSYNEKYSVRFRDIDISKYPDNYPLEMSELNTATLDEDYTNVQIFRGSTDITDNIRVAYSYDGGIDELNHPVECEPIRSDCESLFTLFPSFSPLKGNIVFRYSYKIDGSVTQYSDISELNWTLFDYAENSVKLGTIVIQLPTNENNVNEFSLFSTEITDTVVSIESNDRMSISFADMNEKDSVAFRLLMPNNLFSEIDDNNIIISDNINKQVILDFEADVLDSVHDGERIEQLYVYLPFAVLGLLITLALIIEKLVFTNKSYKSFDYVSSPPSSHSPAQIGYLLNNQSITSKDVVATLLDLIRRGFVGIDDDTFETKDDEVTFYKEKDMDFSTLEDFEQKIVIWLFSASPIEDRVTSTEIENYGDDQAQGLSFISKYNIALSSMNTKGNKANFFDLSIKKRMLLSSFLIILPLGFMLSALIFQQIYKIYLPLAFYVSIPSIIAYLLFIITRKRYSANGYEDLIKWNLYKEYLKDSNNYPTMQFKDIEYWEEALVFATVFGIADKVMEQLDINLKETIDTTNSRFYRYSTMYGTYHSHTLFYHINHMTTTSLATSKSSQPRAASGSGFSGGGGGSFGGGGGGGRSR